MVNIHDLVTATDLTTYYEGTQADSTFIGDALFPARKQLGLRLDFIKGANDQSVVLKASAFDTQASLRDRLPIQLNSAKMPFFKEGMQVKEEDRQQLNQLASGNANQQMLDIVVANIYDDQTTLLKAARARSRAMIMQVLATGKLEIDSNGVKQTIDYNISEDNQGQVETDWAEETADPIGDIDEAIEKMSEIGVSPAGIVLNSKTYGQLRNADETSRRINGAKNKPATRNQVVEFLEDEYNLTVSLVNDTFVNDNGTVQKYFPDGYVTFVPNQSVGNSVYGTTPEESDLMTQTGTDVQVVDTGVAVKVLVKNDPVNTETIVSMINLPSFEGANLIYQLQTDLTADEPANEVDAGDNTEEETP